MNRQVDNDLFFAEAGEPTLSMACIASSRLEPLPLNTADDYRPHLERPHRLSSRSFLPADFRPTPYSIIVGRGRETRENPGNMWLEAVMMTYLDQYAQAKNDKQAKTVLVSEIVSLVVDAYGGCFIKRSSRKDGGRWYEVDNSAARDKVGYEFRELLSQNNGSKSKLPGSKKIQQQQQHHRCSSDESVSYRGQGIVKRKSKQSTERSKKKEELVKPSTLSPLDTQSRRRHSMDAWKSVFDSMPPSFDNLAEKLENSIQLPEISMFSGDFDSSSNKTTNEYQQQQHLIQQQKQIHSFGKQADYDELLKIPLLDLDELGPSD